MTREDCPECGGQGYVECDDYDGSGEHITRAVPCECSEDDGPDDTDEET